MTYDHWKTTPPDNWYGNPDEEADRQECDHDDYDLDILTGRAECSYCEHIWYLTDAELKARERAERIHDRAMRRYGKWWFRLWQRIARRYHEWRHPILTDADVPF